MFETVYLHIGAGKTGTSSIQGTFHRNEEVLRDHGVFLVRTPPTRMLPRFASRPEKLIPVRLAGLKPKQIEQRIAQSDAALRAAVEEGACKIAFMSSEHMLSFDQEEVARMKTYFAPLAHEVKVIYYARHPYSKLASTLNQWIKMGKAVLDQNLKRYLRRFSAELDPWIAVFGVENIIVRPFEVGKMPDRSPVADICTVVDRADMFPHLEQRDANPAISTPAVVIKSLVNAHAVATNGALGPSDYLNDIAGAKFVLPRARIAPLEAEVAAEVAFLRDTFGVTLDAPPLYDAVPERADLFTDEVLLSIGQVMNAQALEIDRLKQQLKTTEKALDEASGG